MFSARTEECRETRGFILPVVCAAPYVFRLMQTLRRYRETVRLRDPLLVMHCSRSLSNERYRYVNPLRLRMRLPPSSAISLSLINWHCVCSQGDTVHLGNSAKYASGILLTVLGLLYANFGNGHSWDAGRIAWMICFIGKRRVSIECIDLTFAVASIHSYSVLYYSVERVLIHLGCVLRLGLPTLHQLGMCTPFC